MTQEPGSAIHTHGVEQELASGSGTIDRRIDRSVPVIIGVYTIVMFRLISRSWYFMDDFVFIWRTTDGEPLLHAMFTPWVSHLLPGDFLLTRLSQVPGPMNWEINAAMTTVGLSVAAVLVWRVLRSLFGSRPLSLLLLVITLTSGSVLITAYWWAAAVELFPLAICLPSMILLLQRALRSPSRVSALLPSVALLGGLFFFDKTIIYVPFLVALVATTPLVAGAPSRALDRLRQAAAPLVVMGGTTLLYLVVYFLLGGGQEHGAQATTAILSRFTVEPITNVLFPNLLGLRTYDLDTRLSAVAILSTLVVLALFLRTCIRHRSGLAYWAILTALVVVNIALVLSAGRRFPDSDRYWADIVFPAVLLIGLSQVGPRSTEETGVRSSRPTMTWFLIACTIAVAAVGGSNLLRSAPHPNTEVAHGYVSTAIDSAQQIDAPITLLTGRVPPRVLGVLMTPWNTTRTVLEPSGGRFTFSTWTTDPYLVQDSGRIVPATFVATRRARLTGLCDARLRDAADLSLEIDMGPKRSDSSVAMIEYTAEEPTTLTVGWNDQRTEVPVQQGNGQIIISMPGGDVPTVSIAQESGHTCVNQFRIGHLVPR